MVVSIIEFLERMEDGKLGKGFDFPTSSAGRKAVASIAVRSRPSGFLAAPRATDASVHPRPVSSPMVGRRVRGVNGGMG